jgi:hypothetical protein
VINRKNLEIKKLNYIRNKHDVEIIVINVDHPLFGLNVKENKFTHDNISYIFELSNNKDGMEKLKGFLENQENQITKSDYQVKKQENEITEKLKKDERYEKN